MSRAIYANLQLWDPLGQMKIEPGLLYGGQSMFFVLAADDLESGLIRLLDAVAQKGLGVVRLLYAGEASNFSDDHFPFEVDMQTMADDALKTGEICALGPYTYEPAAAPESEEVMLACVDLADPAQGGAYAGELRLAATRGNVADGLRALIAQMQAEGLRLKALEDVKDASEHSEVFNFETSVEDMVKRAKDADGVVFSDRLAYEFDS